jgi:hypothetical protein
MNVVVVFNVIVLIVDVETVVVIAVGVDCIECVVIDNGLYMIKCNNNHIYASLNDGAKWYLLLLYYSCVPRKNSKIGMENA